MEDNQQISGQITPEQLEALKQQARELAVAQFYSQQQTASVEASVPNSRVPLAPQKSSERIVYIRRNLTVAELLLILLISCGIVTGLQAGWHFISNSLPRIEIKIK